ncbi:Alpha carbonic anhydrase [Quillaja saponaria]|uniref:Carbonic anhydrase n=1 Tax=Quillaja saponaria TaxID=32244 RepID=A0AAD7KXR8_QUISA|nr:Alpha carbonic anhydrase [Quillaja saponaria]
MEKRLATKILFWSFFIALVQFSCQVKSQEVEDEREFNYDEESEKGPARWGDLHREWSMCKNGQMQSPIDLLNERVEIVSHLGRLNRSYHSSNATIKNRGHDIMLKWIDGAGYIVVNGTQYVLKQLHWHSPSEHTINGRRFNLELHMVHESPTGQTAVVAIMYKIGRPDSFLSMITNHLAAITDITEKEIVLGIIDPKQINIGSRKYYRYIGSLTIPPCTQNVVWTIVRKVRTVTREQVRLLRVAVHDESNSNARSLQPINRRKVHLYRPEDPQQN